MENLFEPNCIRTVSGIYLNLWEPTPEMIRIDDIAHGLANQCRFGGQIDQFYTVAQHSLICSHYMSGVNDDLLKVALLHDATEAYLCDVPSPAKKLMPDYKVIEDRLMQVIAKKFEFEFPFPEEMKLIDAYVLEYEWRALIEKKAFYGKRIEVFSRQIAKTLFLKQYWRLVS